MTARIHVLAACAALVAAIAGCGDDTSGDGSSGTAGGGTGGSGGSGGGATLLNGCSIETAEDESGTATVEMAAWTLGHQQCVKVDVATAVTWNGSFSAHPLAGGPTGMTDDASPITTSDQSGMSATVTFSAAGTFPYYCTVHNASMQGVVYVE